MKSLMRIYIRYIVTALVLIVGFVAIQILILSGITLKLYGNNGYTSLRIGTAYELLKQEPQNACDYLEEQGAAFAMLLDQNGNPHWSYELPEELNHPYSISQVASFSRWYLEDYPVSVWGGDLGLLVVGYPKGTVWNYYIHQDMKGLMGVLTYFMISIPITITAAVLILLVCGFRYYRKMRILADAIGQLALGESVHLPESGTMREISSTINQTSDRLSAQRDQLGQRDLARAEWIRGVSHDIRTPLSLILGYADMIEHQLGPADELGKKAGLIRGQSLRIQKLIEDLNLTSRLEYRMQPLRLKEVCPAVVLRRVAADFLNTLPRPEQYPFSIQIHPEFERFCLQADEELLVRAFQNILGNSIRHNPDGCRLSTEAFILENSAVISFQDSGQGLPPTICRYLNEGILPGPDLHLMGLKIVRQIIEASGGTVSSGHDGHEIRICFPLSSAASKAFFSTR